MAKKRDLGTPSGRPGAYPNCRRGMHEQCARRVLEQAPWRTAGDPPPTPDAEPTRWTECDCECHEVKRASA